MMPEKVSLEACGVAHDPALFKQVEEMLRRQVDLENRLESIERARMATFIGLSGL